MSDIIYKEESYAIIGKCMDVHNQLGHGFSEIVYNREREFPVYYKGILLPHKFYADFVVFDTIILEIKCVKTIADEHVSQAINYLKVSNNKLALLVNFARGKLEYQRIVY